MRDSRSLLLSVIRDELGALIQAINPKWTIPDFHHEILSVLTSGQNCLISMPPDHSKSTIAAVYFTAWWWGRNPEKKVLLALGSPRLVSVFAIQIRQVMEHPIFQAAFDLRIRKDSDGTTIKHSVQGGSFNIVSKSQGISGLRADLIIFDDIVSSAAEAKSVVNRESAWHFITQDLFTRATPGAQKIGIGTRWHHDDVLCRLESSPEFTHFKNLKFKAISDEGKALWPERHSIENLNSIRTIIGSAAFEALYQQSPIASEGGLFKRPWWRTYSERPHFKRVIQFWDCAQKVGITNDFSVCATWGEAHNGFYLLDLWKNRVEAPQLEMAVQGLHAKWSPQAVVIEDKSSGSSLIQTLRQKTTLPVLAYDPKQRDKEVRASAATPLVEAGKCFLPEAAEWVEDFILEHERFPNVEHDDQVDTTSMMAEYMSQSVAQPRIRVL